MPVKCRSCGHLNKDEAKICEQCGCNLQYSLFFDTVIRNQKEESRFLFPINVSDDDEEVLFTEAENHFTDDGSSDLDHKSVIDRNPAPLKENTNTGLISREVQERANQLLIIWTVEILLFMALFLILSMIAKIVAPELVFQNWKLSIVSLVYYGFITFSSLFFTGKTGAFILIGRIIQ